MKTNKDKLVKLCRHFLISYFSDGISKTISDLKKEIIGDADLEDTHFKTALYKLISEGKIIEWLADVDGKGYFTHYQQKRAYIASKKCSPEILDKVKHKAAVYKQKREYFLLRRIDMAIDRANGMLVKKIAVKFGISQSAVRTNIHKAQRRVVWIYKNNAKCDSDYLDDLIQYRKTIVG